MKKVLYGVLSITALTAKATAGAFNRVTNDSQQSYGNGNNSSIGPQINQAYFQRKALVEAQKKKVFSQLADTTAMPKNYGKTIKQYHYLPILDDRNINDQGLDATGAVLANGNLYGSSKDMGTIVGKIPVLTENGGQVNRVGFTRIEITGSLAKFGIYEAYSQESLDFDTDADLEMHIHREMLYAAHEITEDQLQADLLNAAGVIRYGGSAIADPEVTGNSADVISVPTYEGLMKLSTTLDENRTPKNTKIITGTRLIDTETINAARVMFIGSEVLPTLRRMKDLHNEKAFVEVRKYAAAGKVLNNEEGAIDSFRIVVAPEMMHWAGAGKADDGSNAGYRTTNGNYDIFPMLVVGDESFTTIGFQTSKKGTKFKISHVPPKATTTDPYGETGTYSIKWYYGFMALRPERIALYKVVAEI